MEINDFIQQFSDQFDDTDLSAFIPETIYRNLDEWSSLTALAIMNMIDKKYNVRLKNEEMRSTTTIKELFDLVKSKQ